MMISISLWQEETEASVRVFEGASRRQICKIY